jgi:hypothetical protein
VQIVRCAACGHAVDRMRAARASVEERHGSGLYAQSQEPGLLKAQSHAPSSYPVLRAPEDLGPAGVMVVEGRAWGNGAGTDGRTERPTCTCTTVHYHHGTQHYTRHWLAHCGIRTITIRQQHHTSHPHIAPAHRTRTSHPHIAPAHRTHTSHPNIALHSALCTLQQARGAATATAASGAQSGKSRQTTAGARPSAWAVPVARSTCYSTLDAACAHAAPTAVHTTHHSVTTPTSVTTHQY